VAYGGKESMPLEIETKIISLRLECPEYIKITYLMQPCCPHYHNMKDLNTEKSTFIPGPVKDGFITINCGIVNADYQGQYHLWHCKRCNKYSLSIVGKDYELTNLDEQDVKRFFKK